MKTPRQQDLKDKDEVQGFRKYLGLVYGAATALVALAVGITTVACNVMDLRTRLFPAASPANPGGIEFQSVANHNPSADPVPAAYPRPFLPPLDVLTAVAADLRQADAAARSRRRYLTLAPLSNNPKVSDADLDADRQALPDLAAYLNLSRGSPAFQAVDPDNTLFRFSLDDLGWDGDDAWQAVLSQYPYGLSYTDSDDAALQASDQQVRQLSGSRLACVRLDWFVHAVTLPPLGSPDGPLHLPPRDPPTRVRALARSYAAQPLDLAAAAADLGLTRPAPLAALLRDDATLRTKHDLDALTDGGAVRRDAWESLHKGASPFQELSRELHLGTPIIP